MDQHLVEQTQENWQKKVIVIGGAIGLFTGLAAAYLLVQRAEKAQGQPLLNSGEGVKLGLLVLGMLRQITQLGDGK